MYGDVESFSRGETRKVTPGSAMEIFKEEARATYSFTAILYERVAPWFSFQRSGFVEKKVNIGNFAEF